MASRLFQAVVGVGIAMGGALAACGDVTSEETPEAADAAPANGDAKAKADGTTHDDGGAPDAVVIVTDAAPAVDAAIDAPKDVILDAFCDAPWPTTKGSPPVPACVDPLGECAQEES